MEYRGQEPSVVHGSLHGPGYSGGSAITSRYDARRRGGFNDDFHVFAVEWATDRITWFVDGVDLPDRHARATARRAGAGSSTIPSSSS